jgi:hypothetical protein
MNWIFVNIYVQDKLISIIYIFFTNVDYKEMILPMVLYMYETWSHGKNIS